MIQISNFSSLRKTSSALALSLASIVVQGAPEWTQSHWIILDTEKNVTSIISPDRKAWVDSKFQLSSINPQTIEAARIEPIKVPEPTSNQLALFVGVPVAVWGWVAIGRKMKKWKNIESWDDKDFERISELQIDWGKTEKKWKEETLAAEEVAIQKALRGFQPFEVTKEDTNLGAQLKGIYDE